MPVESGTNGCSETERNRFRKARQNNETRAQTQANKLTLIWTRPTANKLTQTWPHPSEQINNNIPEQQGEQINKNMPVESGTDGWSETEWNQCRKARQSNKNTRAKASVRQFRSCRNNIENTDMYPVQHHEPPLLRGCSKLERAISGCLDWYMVYNKEHHGAEPHCSRIHCSPKLMGVSSPFHSRNEIRSETYHGETSPRKGEDPHYCAEWETIHIYVIREK